MNETVYTCFIKHIHGQLRAKFYDLRAISHDNWANENPGSVARYHNATPPLECVYGLSTRLVKIARYPQRQLNI
jgi:hypothetical protein